ncbi:hypothetical protein GU927_012020, partial [Rhodobacteraceae bacterium HSP-20]
MSATSQPSGAYSASADFISGAHIDASGYERLYGESVSDPEGFWRAQGRRVDWIRDYSVVKNTSF